MTNMSRDKLELINAYIKSKAAWKASADIFLALSKYEPWRELKNHNGYSVEQQIAFDMRQSFCEEHQKCADALKLALNIKAADMVYIDTLIRGDV